MSFHVFDYYVSNNRVSLVPTVTGPCVILIILGNVGVAVIVLKQVANCIPNRRTDRIPPLGAEGDCRQARGLVNSFFFLFHLFAIILLVIRYKNNPYAQLVTCAGFMKKYNRKFLPVNASANGGGVRINDLQKTTFIFSRGF